MGEAKREGVSLNQLIYQSNKDVFFGIRPEDIQDHPLSDAADTAKFEISCFFGEDEIFSR